MSSDPNLRIVVGLADRASAPLRGLSGRIEALSASLTKIGAGSLAVGFGMERLMAPMVRAYADLDEGATRLRATLMDAGGGVPVAFKGLSDEAVRLGNLLPGTTNDFYQMFDAMVGGGASAADVMGGLGKATAYLAVVTKRGYVETAALTTGLREVAGIRAEDMLPFIDVLQRITKTGVSADEVSMAFSRSAGALKTLGLQGLDTSKTLGVLYSSLIKVTKSGETAGSGLSTVLLGVMDADKVGKANKALAAMGQQLTFVDQAGQFAGIENLVAQFEKLRGLPQQLQIDTLRELLGSGSEALAVGSALIEQGADGLARQRGELDQQADIQQRVNEILGSTNNLWDALTGSITNVLALLAGPAVESLKPMLKDLNAIVGKVAEWAAANTEVVRTMGLIGGGVAAVLMVGGAGLLGAGLLGKVLPKRGGAAGGLAGAAAGAVQPVFVTNWGGMPGAPGGGAAAGAAAGRVGLLARAGQGLALAGSGGTGWALGSEWYQRGLAGGPAIQDTKAADVIGAALARALGTFSADARAAVAGVAQAEALGRAQSVPALALPAAAAPPTSITLDPGAVAEIAARIREGAITPEQGNAEIQGMVAAMVAAQETARAAADAQGTAADGQGSAADAQGTAASQQQAAAASAAAAAAAMQSAAGQLANIGGVIRVQVTGPAQVTGVSSSGPVAIEAGYTGKGMAAP